jgi:hypothetical protein
MACFSSAFSKSRSGYRCSSRQESYLVELSPRFAQRTKQIQDWVHKQMSNLGRPITFSDLATLWTGTDQSTYASNIEHDIARIFRDKYCIG